jgi:hypothetical protein
VLYAGVRDFRVMKTQDYQGPDPCDFLDTLVTDSTKLDAEEAQLQTGEGVETRALILTLSDFNHVNCGYFTSSASPACEILVPSVPASSLPSKAGEGNRGFFAPGAGTRPGGAVG